MKKRLISLALLAALPLGLCACSDSPTEVYRSDGTNAAWTVGFGSSEIIPDNIAENPLYIAGYDSDRLTSVYLDNNELEVYDNYRKPTDTPDYDYAQARAVWIDAGGSGTLLIGIDCVGLSNAYVEKIRDRLAELCSTEDCASVNVYATHSHALPDTLGLWGPLGVDGKDDAYMSKLVDAAVAAAEQAVADRRTGELRYGKVATDPEFLRDSRYPYAFDANLHQLRFAADDGSGVRLYFYGAHAESMRGDNKILSRDFPGVMCDLVTYETGDNAIFLPAAIGGLVMTQVLVEPFGAKRNLQVTGRTLADYALSITPEMEEVLSPEISVARTEFTVPLDNNAFMYYQFLGILECDAVRGESRTGYHARTEMSLIQLGSVSVALIPGEIFPELVYGGEYGYAGADDAVNPTPLVDLATEHGVEHLLIVGLANDELGYIVPPSDFLVNAENPYLEKQYDALGENHYEETNSVGPACAQAIADAFTTLLEAMD